MRFCEECGAQLDDDVKFCEECGTPVSSVEEEESVIYETPVIQEQTEPKKELEIKKFDVKKYLVPAVAGVVLLLVIGIGLVIFGGDKNTNDSLANNTSSEGSSDDTDENNTDTTVGGNSEVDTEVDTEGVMESETDSTTENLGMSEEEYALMEEFFNAACMYGDPPDFETEEEMLAYEKQEYERWRNGKGYEYVVIAEDGHVYCELFPGAPYGVYIINEYTDDFEYFFWIEKQGSVYKATYIEQYYGQRGSCTFEITDSYICLDKDNTMKCKIEGEEPVTVHVTFYTYNPSYSGCIFILALEYADGTIYEKIGTVILDQNTTYKTFETYEEFYYYMNN